MILFLNLYVVDYFETENAKMYVHFYHFSTLEEWHMYF